VQAKINERCFRNADAERTDRVVFARCTYTCGDRAGGACG